MTLFVCLFVLNQCQPSDKKFTLRCFITVVYETHDQNIYNYVTVLLMSGFIIGLQFSPFLGEDPSKPPQGPLWIKEPQLENHFDNVS